MRIGELAARAGASTRQVRFYESRGLIASTRGANNYRDYTETTLARVQQIRELLTAGLCTLVGPPPDPPTNSRTCYIGEVASTGTGTEGLTGPATITVTTS